MRFAVASAAVAMLLAAPGAVASHGDASATGAATVPALTGTFLAIDVGRDFTQADWDRELAAMRGLGMTWVAARAAMRENSAGPANASMAAECPIGIWSANYPSTLQPEACYGAREPSALAGGAIGGILRAANASGMKVHIGAAMPHDEGGLPGGTRIASAEEIYDRLGNLHADVMLDIAKAFPSLTHVIAGCYTDVELWNTRSWTSAANANNLAAYYEIIGLRLKAAGGPFHGSNMTVWASPYYIGNATLHHGVQSAASYAAFWGDVFRLAPSFDAIALQDSRGWQGNTDAMVAAVLPLLRDAVTANGGALWSNTEVFEGWPAPCEYPVRCGRHPAPIARVVAQLRTEAPFVTQRTAWEWLTCLSPFTNNNTAALFRGYSEAIGL